MRVYEAKPSLLNFRPCIAVLPWMLFGMAATFLAATVMATFPWLPGVSQSGTPLIVQIALVIGGVAVLVLLVPAQVRALLRELFGRYTIETDESSLRIRFTYPGGHGAKEFLWDEIADLGLYRAGLPSCGTIRIDPTRGYWFSFGTFFNKQTRYEVLDHILHAYRAVYPNLSSNAA